MRIGVWNVEYAFASRLNGLRSVLLANEADIWVLTETNDHLVPRGLSYAAHSGLRRTGFPAGMRHGSRWVSIWSRYPILHQVETVDADNRTVAALIAAPACPVLVYGTVLPWPASKPTFVEALAEQGPEWLKLKQAYPDAVMCIAGDLNADMNKSNRFPGKAGIAALEAAMLECGLVCATGPGKISRGVLAKLPIDHLLLPEYCSARVIAAWEGTTTEGVRLSDHSGLVVSAQLVNPSHAV